MSGFSFDFEAELAEFHAQRQRELEAQVGFQVAGLGLRVWVFGLEA